MDSQTSPTRLAEIVRLSPDKIVNSGVLAPGLPIRGDLPVLVLLAAGKGTRFGISPKCVQPVCGVPVARHTINAFKSIFSGPVICVVGYRHAEVMGELGDDLVYVHTDNPTGGTAFAVLESFSVAELHSANPVMMVAMGDRVVPASVFERIHAAHTGNTSEADLTLLSAQYEPPGHQGKGRILRDDDRRVLRIVEQRDIDAMPEGADRKRLENNTEANCSLFAARARTFHRVLSELDNNNAQSQYYLTDSVAAIRAESGEIRSVITTPGGAEHDLVTCDVTRPADLDRMEAAISSVDEHSVATRVAQAAGAIRLNRPTGQILSIAAQLEEVVAVAKRDHLGLSPDRPVGIGISGGRLRIAFMHPDMGRFFGPAWQMPIGAADESGREQIVVVTQTADDGKLHLYPTDPQFRERLNAVPSDPDFMYPGEEVADWYTFEGFGTRMAERLLLSLGYFSDADLDERTKRGDPLPPPSLWLSNSMRRPFSLVGNAIASLRTLRAGSPGARVQTYLGRDGFTGLRVVSTGNIPRGGFSSSSAVTLATKNALDSLYGLGIPADLLVNLACQAEYGTGVRAGSLDQATEQMGQAGRGTLISSNPSENYRVIGEYPVPSDRIKVTFPYTIDRDREAWKWSYGLYAGATGEPEPTTSEMRKLTGKAAELTAILTHLPLDTDFFPAIEAELVENGELGTDARRAVCDILLQVPLLVSSAHLRTLLSEHRAWYAEQLATQKGISIDLALTRTDSSFESLFAGWRDPLLRRGEGSGEVVEETGVPLRAMMAYLFGEVAKNFYLIHHTDQWIEFVTRSQAGDRCLEIDLAALPSAEEMLVTQEWESGLDGPDLLTGWLDRCNARPVNYNSGLDDKTLAGQPIDLHLMEGGNFFRGIALIDLAEAMLKRAFGAENIAVRVNAAGQGDFFQIHTDTAAVDNEAVKEFVRQAFYIRFGLAPIPDFVELHPGGGAQGVRLDRFDLLAELARQLRLPAG